MEGLGEQRRQTLLPGLNRQIPVQGLEASDEGNGPFFPRVELSSLLTLLSALEFIRATRGQECSRTKVTGTKLQAGQHTTGGFPRARRQPLPPRTSKAQNETSLPGPGQMCSSSRQMQTKFIKKSSKGTFQIMSRPARGDGLLLGGPSFQPYRGFSNAASPKCPGRKINRQLRQTRPSVQACLLQCRSWWGQCKQGSVPSCPLGVSAPAPSCVLMAAHQA